MRRLQDGDMFQLCIDPCRLAIICGEKDVFQPWVMGLQSKGELWVRSNELWLSAPARPREYLDGYGERDSRESGCQNLVLPHCFRGGAVSLRQRSKSNRSPHFHGKVSNEIVWLGNFSKWNSVDGEVAAPEMQAGHRLLPQSSGWMADHHDPRGPPGCERGLTPETASKLCQQGHLTEAVEVVGVLVKTGYRFSKTVFYNVLKECTVQQNLIVGRRIHALTVQQGYQSDTFLCNHILRMYACHARLQEATDVFTTVPEPDAFMWSSIISAYVQHGQAKQAIQLYHQMRRSNVKPDGHVFVAALQACARGADLESGQQVHADVLASELHLNRFVSSCLVDMYAKCGMGEEALRLYSEMQQEGIAAPDSVTFLCLLQACASWGTPALKMGKQLHAQIEEQGLQSDVIVANSLINMYAKCGSLDDAQSVFEGLSQKDVVTWNAMLAAYSQQGMFQEVIHLHSVMEHEGSLTPDSVTFICLLQACASIGISDLQRGKYLHRQIEERGLKVDVVLGCSLVNMYAKCGSLHDAQSVFDGLDEKNVVTWNALIAGYAQKSMGQEALELYGTMQEEGISTPNSVTFVCLLQACASLGITALEQGKQFHRQIEEQGLHVDAALGCSLVNLYAKCGSPHLAHSVFDKLPQKDVATWTALIAGYSQQGMDHKAFCLVRAMQLDGCVPPDSVTFVCLLQACASVADLHIGRQLHAQIKEQGLEADVPVAMGLISMYAKGGSMVDAQRVFDALPERGIVAWNAMIAGYTRQGDSGVVFDLVQRMTEHGVHPNGVTFLCVLTVCSHVGAVSKGQEYFETMNRQFGIHPTMEHFSCMVDLLGRAGQLDEALEVVKTMPVQPDKAVWRTLLGACQKWSNVEVGRHAFDEAVKLEEPDAAEYVLMANIYMGAQMWEEGLEIQLRRKRSAAWKRQGQSWWTDADGLVHTFSVGDKLPESVHLRLKQLIPKMKELGTSSCNMRGNGI